jgi:Flp pilus assembly protein TadG
MFRLRIHHHAEESFLKSPRKAALGLLKDERGAALLEFAIVLPLLVVFVVGIYDFSGAFNQKQKIEQAAQEGTIVAGSQPTSDLQSTSGNPNSLQAVVTAVFNSLVSSGVVPNGTCSPPGATPGPAGLTWVYTISGCNGSNLVITINRGWVCGGATCPSGEPVAVGTMVTVTYPYHWQFNRVIQLLIPGANYAATTTMTESATVHNQM